MSSTPSRPGDGLAPFNFRFLDDPDSAPSLMDRVAQNQSLLQDAAQRTQSVVQNGLLNNQQVQQQRLALAQMTGAQNVTAARASADIAVTDSTYQAAHDDAAWREANAADLALARAELPTVLDAINAETDPFRLRDAAITFHGRYAHLAGDPALGDQYKALDGRVAARLQARDEEFRARISTAAAGLRPLIDPAAPDQLAAICADPRYLLARLDPAFAQQMDDATQQAAELAKQAQASSSSAGSPLAANLSGHPALVGLGTYNGSALDDRGSYPLSYFGVTMGTPREVDAPSNADVRGLLQDAKDGGLLLAAAAGSQTAAAAARTRAIQEKRALVNDIATKLNGAKVFAFEASFTKQFPNNSNKCNAFVGYVLLVAGLDASSHVRGRDAFGFYTAGEWASRTNRILNGWRTLGPGETPQPGDIFAWALPGHSTYTGHTGIVISDGTGGLNYMAAHGDGAYPNPNQLRDAPNPGSITYRRYVGGSR